MRSRLLSRSICIAPVGRAFSATILSLPSSVAEWPFTTSCSANRSCWKESKESAAENALELFEYLEQPARVVVTPLQLSDLIALRTADVLIDARVQKYSITPDCRHIAKLSVGLGPNFVVGENCDLAIETRPAQVGRMVEVGSTDPPDHNPQLLGGVGAERFVYSDRQGLWHSPLEIGARVYKGVVIGNIEGLPIAAPIDGFIRGLVRDGLRTPHGVKLLEIDPRGRAAVWTGIDEHCGTIAKAVTSGVRIKLARKSSDRRSGPARAALDFEPSSLSEFLLALQRSSTFTSKHRLIHLVAPAPARST